MRGGQGQFTHYFFGNDSDVIDSQIKNIVEQRKLKCDNEKKYPYGTVIPIKHDERTSFLLVMADTLGKGVYETNFGNLQQSLSETLETTEV